MRHTTHATPSHGLTQRAWCALAAAWVLTATGCPSPNEPVMIVTPGGFGVVHDDAFDRPHARRSPDLPRYDADDRPKTSAVGSEDLVSWRGERGLVASDTTTDAVYIVDVEARALTHRVSFEEGAAPGRLAATRDTAFVVLQGAGALARFDTQGEVTGRVKVCAAPRGVAVDAEHSRVWVACASSEVVGVDMETFEVASTWFVDADLRDVAVMGTKLYVSRFHAAELLVVDAETGQTVDRTFMPTGASRARDNTHTGVLWRMKRDEDKIITSYQQMNPENLVVAPPEENVSGYGSRGGGGRACDSAVLTMNAIVTVDDDGHIESTTGKCVPDTPLPVDIELDPCGVSTLSAAITVTHDDRPFEARCTPGLLPRGGALAMERMTETGTLYLLGRDTSLFIRIESGRYITLDDDSPAHLGHVVFHGNTGLGITCASCHPGGGSDGHAWGFEAIDANGDSEAFTRRTQTLNAGIEGRLHWDGEFTNMGELMGDVFSERMGGFEIQEDDAVAIRDWLAQLAPEPGVTHPPEEAEQVARGATLFGEAGCGDCHSGSNLTDHQFYDVGTGKLLKTPTLRGIAHRKTFIHDGCADTLRARFDQDCGGAQHGDVAGMTSDDLDALTTYLETL